MSRATFLERLILSYQRQPARTKAVVWVAILGLLVLLVPQAIRQRQISQLSEARVYFATPQSSVIPGEPFPVEIRVQTDGTPINAVSAVVRYAPNTLEVVHMTTEKSFCTFYLDNRFDNIKGEVVVSCGVANPGFQGDSVVVRLTMRAKAVGTTTITLDQKESQVLANDGKGTNITDELPSLPLTIKQLF